MLVVHTITLELCWKKSNQHIWIWKDTLNEQKWPIHKVPNKYSDSKFHFWSSLFSWHFLFSYAASKAAKLEKELKSILISELLRQSYNLPSKENLVMLFKSNRSAINWCVAMDYLDTRIWLIRVKNTKPIKKQWVYLIILEASSASGSAQYLLARIRHASADSIWDTKKHSKHK